MAPKKVKDSPQVLSWQDVIVQCQLSDDDWSVKVVVVEAAGSSQDRLYLQNFENYVKEDKRFVIKNICKTETIFMISQLGSDSRANTNNNKVFEEAQTFLRAKMDIPSENYALIIKQLIMKLKEDDQFIKRQKVVVQEGLRRESAAILNKTEIKGNKLLDPLTDEETKKYNTKLRLRGEEWRNKIYVEDHPLDGPDLYVIITNFMDSDLLTCLIKIGVPIAAIVQLRIDLRASEIPPELILHSKRVPNETEEIEKASCYWNDLLRMRTAPDTSDFLKDTSFIVFTPPYWDTHKLSAQPEQIYDELCYLAYDVQDLTRQHTNFLDNIEIIKIHEPINDDNQKLLKFYCQQIDDIPLEYITMYSILDSLLWTVSCIDLENKTDSSADNSEANTKNNNDLHVSTNLVTEVFKTLCQTSENKKTYRITYGDELDFNKDPTVISYGDKVKCKTFMLGNINMDSIIKKTLTGMPLYQLWQLFLPLQKELLAKINFHVNVLLTCFDRTDIETTELCRLLHILACRKLYNNRSLIQNIEIQSTISQFKNTYLKRSLIAEPISKIPSNYGMLSHSIMALSPNIIKYENESTIFSCCVSTDDSETLRIRNLFDCPDISELASAAEIACSCPIDHYIDEFDHFEDYKGSSAFQVLHEAYNTFNCINYKYCEVTDCIILIFFNSFDADNIFREQWRSHLPTAVCLQDFFDFVLEEHMDWIKEEENKHDELIKTLYPDTDGINQTDIEPKCIDDYDIDLDMVLEGSLKHQELIKNDNTSTIGQNAESAVSMRRETQSVKNSKSNISRHTIAERPQSLPIIPGKPFSGYDLGDRRLEAFGKHTKYYGADGTRISSNYNLIIPMFFEWITLNLTPGNCHNEIWIHRVIRDNDIPIENEANDIRITGKDGIIINILKKTYEITLLDAEMLEKTDNNMQTTSLLEDSQHIPLTETVIFHSLCITWPNGLLLEPVYEHDSSIISHIKLTYLRTLSNLTEETRCVSLNGEVIVFQLSGNIDVLRPDGTFIKITKCGKRKVIPRVQEEEKASIISGPKGKKGKSKANKVNQDLRQSKEEMIPTTYELIIDEYDIIDPNGEVQRYEDKKFVFVDKLLVRTATDYNLGEIFSRRMDGTNILLNKDGLQIVTFPDGTRIITQVVVEDEEIFVEWSAEELELVQTDAADVESDVTKSKSLSKKSVKSFSEVHKSKKSFSSNKIEIDTTSDGYISVHLVHIIEHKNFATVTSDTFKGLITLDSPNNVSINIQFNNHFNIKLDEATTAKFDGNNLKVAYKTCTECKVETKCDIKIIKELQKENGSESIRNYWLKMKNSSGKMVIVSDEGGITESDVSNQSIKLQCASSSEEMDDFEFLEEEQEKELPEKRDHSKCKEPYENNNTKFFVVHRNLNCTELVRQDSVDSYKTQYQHHPWFSTNSYDSFGDHRQLISMLTPLDLNETDKWLMESKLASKPKNLTYKDLKTDGGKGFYHWMRPYKRFTPIQRKPENVLPSLPRAYVLRTLEKQWPENLRTSLKGAKELIKAILQYRKVIEVESETIMDVPIIDTRHKSEKDVDKALQNLAAWVYKDLKLAVSEELQARAKKGITTKPLPQDDELSVSGEEQSKFSLEDIEAMRRTLDKEVEMSSKLKRYWKQREEKYKEELFYQYLLREGTVPPYFKNILAGALWWEIDQLAIKAAYTAERRKTVCTCDEERQAEKKVEILDPENEEESEQLIV